MFAAILRSLKQALCGEVSVTMPAVSHELRWPIISYETRDSIDKEVDTILRWQSSILENNPKASEEKVSEGIATRMINRSRRR